MKLMDQVRDVLRKQHYSIRTEQAYVDWIKRYTFFHDKRHPQEMGAAEDGLDLKGSRNGLMIVIPGAPAKEAAPLPERAPARG